MGHLMSSLKEEPHFERVGVGNAVEYFGRAGSMRQGRTSFPALVLKQHPDDGSLDLLVFFEAEDILWEQRVLPWSEERPNRCWAPLGDIPKDDDQHDVAAAVLALSKQIYGDFEPPPKSVMDYLNDFDERLRKIERQATAPKGKKKG